MGDDQNDVITARQLASCGVSEAGIRRRVTTGRLFPKHRGVYAIGRADLSPAGVFHAAALAIGEDAVVSHCAAAALHGFWNRRIDRVEVTVARRVRPRAGIRVYCVEALPRSDWRWREGMRVTTAERTVLDLAAKLRPDELFRRTVHEALVQERVSEPSLRRAIDAHPGHKGATRLAAELRDGAKPTRSGFEDWLVQLLRSDGFPPFLTNTRPAGTPRWVEVDVLFPDQRLVVEVDGERYHKTKYRRETDARKQAVVEAAGFRVLRVTEDDGEPRAAARIRSALT